MAGSIVSSYGESYYSLFLFTRFCVSPPKPRSYLYAGIAKYLEGLVVLCGFRVFDRDTKCVAIFFFERSCVEQEIIRRPLTVRTAVTTKEKKLVRVMPVRWNTVNIVFGT